MRMVTGVLGIVIVVAIIGMLAKKQLQPPASRSATVGTDGGTAPVAVTPALPQQVGASVAATVQQARPIPDDK